MAAEPLRGAQPRDAAAHHQHPRAEAGGLGVAAARLHRAVSGSIRLSRCRADGRTRERPEKPGVGGVTGDPGTGLTGGSGGGRGAGRGADGGERRGADAARGRTRIGGYKPRGPPWAGPGASPGCLAHCPDGSGAPRTLGAKVSTEEHSGPPPGGSFFQRSQESGDQMAEEASPCCVTDAGQHPRLGTPRGPWVEVGGRPDESSDVRAGREELHASGATAT